MWGNRSRSFTEQKFKAACIAGIEHPNNYVVALSSPGKLRAPCGWSAQSFRYSQGYEGKQNCGI